MFFRHIVALAVVVALLAAPAAAADRDGARPGRDDSARRGGGNGEVGKGPPPGRGPGRGPGGRGPGGGFGPGPGSRRPDGTDGHGKGYRYRYGRLTKEQEAELLKHLEKHQPEISKRLAELRKKDERRYRPMLSRLWVSYQRLKDLPEDLRTRIYAKEAARRNIYRLLTAIRKASPEDKERLTSELRQAVTVQFESEQAEREYRLTQLAKEIERVRAELKARLAQREKIIAERIERLLEMSEHIGRHKPKPPAGKDHKPPVRPE